MSLPRRTMYLLPLVVVGLLAVASQGREAGAVQAVLAINGPARVGMDPVQVGAGQAERLSPAARLSPAPTLPPDCLDGVNATRAALNMSLLTIDTRVAAAATSHSAYQAQQQKMSHAGSGGSDAGNRLTAAGYVWTAWGENVAVGQPDCAAVVNAWMLSPSHRANILDPSFRHIGIGVIVGTNGFPYWTMNLAVGG